MRNENPKTKLAQKLLKCRKNLAQQPKLAPSCFIGFDGFTDEIIHAVDTRLDKVRYQSIAQMAAFGQRIIDASQKSCNIELVQSQKKIGGNAPIMTDALLYGGHRITLAGAIGIPRRIEPLFKDLASRCTHVYPLGPSGHSDAIEFEDGKVILGKYQSVQEIGFDTLLKTIGKASLIQLLDSCDLFVSANWTMLPLMTDLWRQIAKKITPHFSKRETPRWMFVDLADPAKRTDFDLAAAIKALKSLQGPFQVILGLNEAEALRVAAVLGKTHLGKTRGNIRALASYILSQSKLHQVVVHARKFASSATEKVTEIVDGPYIAKPLLTTGGGDNFNAGFCNALLYNLSIKEMLLAGVATSGYYIRQGKSPTIPELAAFLKEWK